MTAIPNTIALIANGSIDNYDKIKTYIQNYEKIVAVDGGLAHLDKMGIIPNLLIGDLDSLTPELRQKYSAVEVLQFPQHKDETDLELALNKVYSSGITRITLFGVLGKRTDHALYNLHLLRRYKKILIQTENEIIFSVSGSMEIACEEGQTISFIPLADPVRGITTEGLKWELHDANFDKNFMSISNICLKNLVRINIEEGDLLCVLQEHQKGTKET